MIAIDDYLLLKAEVAKIKRLRSLTNADLGRMTGYARETITKFLGTTPKDRADSERVANALISALDIDSAAFNINRKENMKTNE